MESDDLQSLWSANSLERAGTASRAFALASVAGRATTTLGRLRRLLWLELASASVAAFLTGSFVGDHFGEPRALLAGVFLQVYAIAIVAACVAQLVALGGAPPDGPVVAIATSVERLYVLRARTAYGTLAAAPLAWVPLAVVAVRLAFGAAAVASLDLRWVVANLTFGAGAFALLTWLARRFGDASAAPIVRGVTGALAGRTFRLAVRRLRELRRYDEEPQAGGM